MTLFQLLHHKCALGSLDSKYNTASDFQWYDRDVCALKDRALT